MLIIRAVGPVFCDSGEREHKSDISKGIIRLLLE